MKEYEVDVLRRLAEAGVGFVVVSDYEVLHLGVEDVIAYVADPDTFIARRFGVSAALYRAWRDFVRDPHCSVKTSKGRYCKHPVDTPTRPSEFVAGVTDVCGYHRERL